jgi:hypothetical protein
MHGLVIMEDSMFRCRKKRSTYERVLKPQISLEDKSLLSEAISIN